MWATSVGSRERREYQGDATIPQRRHDPVESSQVSWWPHDPAIPWSRHEYLDTPVTPQRLPRDHGSLRDTAEITAIFTGSRQPPRHHIGHRGITSVSMTPQRSLWDRDSLCGPRSSQQHPTVLVLVLMMDDRQNDKFFLYCPVLLEILNLATNNYCTSPLPSVQSTITHLIFFLANSLLDFQYCHMSNQPHPI